jgi:hypothetical protein
MYFCIFQQLCSLKRSRTNHPVMQYRVTKEQIPHPHCCEKLKSHTIFTDLRMQDKCEETVLMFSHPDYFTVLYELLKLHSMNLRKIQQDSREQSIWITHSFHIHPLHLDVLNALSSSEQL